jgi:hypothetical protein
MPCYYGHPSPDAPTLESLSRREILGISGLSALAIAGGGLLVSNCKQPAETHEGNETPKEPSSEFYRPTFGVLTLFPPDVTTMEKAKATQLEAGKCYVHIPYYNDTKLPDLKPEDVVSCRILFIGGDLENPLGAIAVNLRREEVHAHDSFTEAVMKKRAIVDTALRALGYERLLGNTKVKICPQ